MKKMIAVLLVVMMIPFGAFAGAPEQPMLEGAILEITDTEMLLETETHGQVTVWLPDEATLPEGRKLAVGQYVYVHYSGAMTRSLPPQVTAQAVERNDFVGLVLQHGRDNIVIEGVGCMGTLQLLLPDDAPSFSTGMYLWVNTMRGENNILSYIPQWTAAQVDPFYLMGTIVEVGEDIFLLNTPAGHVVVHLMGDTLGNRDLLVEGAPIAVCPGEMMLLSEPAQVTAVQFIPVG